MNSGVGSIEDQVSNSKSHKFFTLPSTPRFQTANDTYSASLPVAEKITRSFAVREVEANPSSQGPASLRAL